MKEFAVICLISIVAFSCNKDKITVRTDREMANLKGNVRTVDRKVHNAEARIGCPCSDRIELNQSSLIFNENGNLKESSLLDEDGNVVETSRYLYNRKGICTGIEKFSDDKKVARESLVLDGGRVTRLKIYDENNAIVKSISYVYSGNDVCETKTLDKAGSVTRAVLNNFVNGELVSQTEKDGNGIVKAIGKFARNSNNDVTEYTISVPQSNAEYKFLFEYEYDKKGNWIKQTQYYDGRIVNVIIRNITYFEG